MDKNSSIKPSKGYVVAEPTDNEKPDGYTIVDNETPQRAKVLLVGENTYHTSGQEFKAPCGEGDTVIHSGFGFEDIKVEGKKLRLIPFDKILGVINDN